MAEEIQDVDLPAFSAKTRAVLFSSATDPVSWSKLERVVGAEQSREIQRILVTAGCS